MVCSDHRSLRFDAAIATVRPDLATAAKVRVGLGWDCEIVIAGGSVFRFPRHDGAAARLIREPGLLRLVAPRVPIAVPAMTLHTVPMLFTEHAQIPGAMVDPADYDALGEEVRDALAQDLAATYVAFHRIGLDEAREAGAVPVGLWAPSADLFAALRQRLDAPLLGLAAQILSAVDLLPADETVFGHFDSHGWNMAFDRDRGRLVGLFDFGDSGIGALHRDLSYPCFISPDLTARIVARYRRLTRRPVDLERVFTLHTALRLVEVAEAPADEARQVWTLTDWLASLSRFRGGCPSARGWARGWAGTDLSGAGLSEAALPEADTVAGGAQNRTA